MTPGRRAIHVLPVVALLAGCGGGSPPVNVREYPLTGEVRSIKPDRTEITVKHDDVKGFMPAMTMAFPVKRPEVLGALAPGDLIKATLVVTDEESYLLSIHKTGTAPPQARGDAMPAEAPAPVQPGEALPAIPLTDESGQPRPLSALRGRVVLLTFIYTRCPLPDYCPRMDRYFAAIQEAIRIRPPLKAAVQLLSISFDPDFDTPARLEAHARTIGADPALWHFVTAPRRDIDDFGARLGLSVVREGPDGQDIIHNLRTVLVDRNGLLVKTYNGNDWSPDAVVRDLEALIR